jgi:hypothetical protein
MGDTYFAVCGVETPYLDHAPRSVRFAFEVRAEVRRFAEENDLDLDVSGGVDAGPVTVGLIGNARLIYDLWGETAEHAVAIAGLAGDGEILVTDDVRDRLPGGDDLAAFEPMPRRKLLEITHFHLFSMPVYLLILSHMYMLSRSRKTAKAAWIGVGSFGTLLHIAAPWLVAQASVGALASYAISGAMLFISYSVMSVVPLWEMWRR